MISFPQSKGGYPEEDDDDRDDAIEDSVVDAELSDGELTECREADEQVSSMHQNIHHGQETGRHDDTDPSAELGSEDWDPRGGGGNTVGVMIGVMVGVMIGVMVGVIVGVIVGVMIGVIVGVTVEDDGHPTPQGPLTQSGSQQSISGLQISSGALHSTSKPKSTGR